MYPRKPWLKFIINPDSLDVGGGDSGVSKPDADALQNALDGKTDEVGDKGNSDDDEGKSSEDDKKSDDDDSNPWAEKFGDLTPDDVQGQIDEWKSHSRDWEKKSKANLAELEKLRKSGPEDNSHLVADMQRDLDFYTDLVGMVVTSESPETVIQLLDSRSFRNAYERLDRDDDKYSESLQALIEARSNSVKPVMRGSDTSRNGGGAGGGERYDDHKTDVGAQLFDELYGSKK